MKEKASERQPAQRHTLAHPLAQAAARGATLRLTPAGHEAALVRPYEEFTSTLESAGFTPGQGPSGAFDFAALDDEKLGLAGRPADPPVVSRISEGQCERLLLHLTPAHPCFAGHFENEPILAGVVQLHWAASIAGHFLEYDHPPQRVYRLKFRHIAVPPRLVELRLDLTAAPRVTFGYSSHPHPHAQGVLEFDGNR